MTDTITLGGRQFLLRPLKLGQLRLVLDALERMTGKSGGALVEAAAEVVAAGLVPAYPGLAAEAILDLEATLDELNTAVAAILKVAGLRPPGEPTLGESRAAPPLASHPGGSSPPFTAPSPPAAPTRTPSLTA